MSCGADDERGKKYLGAIPDLTDEIRGKWLEPTGLDPNWHQETLQNGVGLLAAR